MENNRGFRIRTSTDDKIVQTQLSQDIDFLEVLSLKLRMKDSYRLHSSSYGIVMGRVLANDAFGVPNAKVSIFIERDGNEPIDIRNLYPYESVMSRDKNGVKYNLLHDVCDDVCHADVGTFPNKRRVLDNDTVLYVYDKYYKYTTSTNSAGDYMIYGVPVGSQQVHVDIDLSDIGVLSQRPRDMVYKGYDINEFENACQFKTSTNLYNLPQIITQEQNVDVYPFFGDSKQNDIAISRCDIHINYKFEPTCVFMGSVVTDNGKNAISNRCRPSRKAGYNRNLVAANGTIEMIRKTPGGYVEEYNVNGAQLIDGDGVWCYQIPMNLDYIGTDEYGNMVPTDDPKKGIPTRSRVRFRISINETGEEAASRHRAKMLVPSVPLNQKGYSDDVYEFGSDTPEEYYRDIYWNKVYSIKSYVPRIQKYKSPRYDRFVGLKKVNDDGGFNPIPFNGVRVRTPFLYSFLCTLSTVFITVMVSLNTTVIDVLNFLNSPMRGLLRLVSGGKIDLRIPCLKLSIDDTIYAPGCTKRGLKSLAEKEGVPTNKVNREATAAMDAIQSLLAEDFDVVNMDFSNDWLNGCMYMPMFHYKGRMKWTILGIPFTVTSKKKFCSCDNPNRRLKLYESCALIEKPNPTNESISVIENNASKKKEGDGRTGEADDEFKIELNHGIIKEFINKDGLPIYYYKNGELSNGTYFHLYDNDLILLGSINECDMDGVPQLIKHIPSTTSNVPEFYAEYENDDDTGDYEITGVDWGSDGDDEHFVGGYFTNIKCANVHTMMKTCINAERLCELGVGVETKGEESVSTGDGSIKSIEINTLGAVTHKDVFGDDSRSVFATLNSNPLIGKLYDHMTGYKKYDYDYVYTMGFDGKMNSAFKRMKMNEREESDKAFIKYRFGGEPKYGGNEKGGMVFPIYENSFYFYFGLVNGKTAIDKLNTLYYSECKEPDVEGFSYTVESQTNKECSEDKAFIKLNLRNVARPCSITVERNGAVMEELCRNNYNNTEYEMTDGVKNGNYRITIEDVNGIIKSEDVSLVNNKMGLLYDKDNLGFDYDAHADEPNYGQENGRNGKFIISGATIYGESVRFKEINIKSNTNPYELICKTEDGKEVSVLIEHNDSTPYEYKVDETTEDKNTYQFYVMKYDKVSKGNSVSFVLICDGEETEYFNNFEYDILNGEDFRAYVNDMPAENILAMNDGWGYDAEDVKIWNFDENYNAADRLSAILSICKGIYCTDTDEDIRISTVGGNDVKYMYTAPNVDYPSIDGKVEKFVEMNTVHTAYINPDIPFEKNGVKTVAVDGDEYCKYYYFAATTNNGEGIYQSIPGNAHGNLIYENNKDLVRIDPEKANTYLRIPYIDRRLTVEGTVVINRGVNGKGSINLKISNGIALKYDNDGNCVGEGLEWDVDNGNIYKTEDTETSKRRLYKLFVNDNDMTDTCLFNDFGKRDDDGNIIPSECVIDAKELKLYDAESIRIDATSCSYGMTVDSDENGNIYGVGIEQGQECSFAYPYNIGTIKASLQFNSNEENGTFKIDLGGRICVLSLDYNSEFNADKVYMPYSDNDNINIKDSTQESKKIVDYKNRNDGGYAYITSIDEDDNEYEEIVTEDYCKDSTFDVSCIDSNDDTEQFKIFFDKEYEKNGGIVKVTEVVDIDISDVKINVNNKRYVKISEDNKNKMLCPDNITKVTVYVVVDESGKTIRFDAEYDKEAEAYDIGAEVSGISSIYFMTNSGITILCKY